jgi:hypothetical protein
MYNMNNRSEALLEGERIRKLLQGPPAYERVRIELEPQATGFDIEAFLERAGQACLNPFSNEIWLARMGKRAVAVTTHAGICMMGERSGRIDSVASFPVGEHDRIETDFCSGIITYTALSGGVTDGAWAMVRSDGKKNTTFCHVRNNYNRDCKAPLTSVAASMAIRHVLGFGDLIVTDELVARDGGTRRVEPHVPAYLLSAPSLEIRWLSTANGEKTAR